MLPENWEANVLGDAFMSPFFTGRGQSFVRCATSGISTHDRNVNYRDLRPFESVRKLPTDGVGSCGLGSPRSERFCQPVKRDRPERTGDSLPELPDVAEPCDSPAQIISYDRDKRQFLTDRALTVCHVECERAIARKQ